MPNGLQLLEMNVIQGAMNPQETSEEMNALLGKVKKTYVANEPSEFSH